MLHPARERKLSSDVDHTACQWSGVSTRELAEAKWNLKNPR